MINWRIDRGRFLSVSNASLQQFYDGVQEAFAEHDLIAAPPPVRWVYYSDLVRDGRVGWRVAVMPINGWTIRYRGKEYHDGETMGYLEFLNA